MRIWQDKVAIESAKLGVFFFILFTAYLSFQNIVTHVYEQQGLSAVGPLNLIVNYLSFLISNTLAVKCKISFKAQMFIGSLAYTVNLSTGIFVPYIENHAVIYFIVALGGLIGGISAGFLWVSQGGYLREVCKDQNNKGKYNAIFSFFLSLSSLSAGITTTFFLGYFDEQVYFKALVTLGLFSSLYCVFFIKRISQPQSQSQSTNQLTKESYESLVTVAEDIHYQSNENQEDSIVKHQERNESQTPDNKLQQNLIKNPQNKEISVMKNVIDSLKFYRKMTFVLMFMIIDGLALGIQSNQMTKLIPQQMKSNQQDYRLKAGILTIFIGAGSLVGSYLSGPISDQFGLKLFGKVTIFSYVVTCLLTFAASLQQMYWLACTMSFLWGLTYYFFQGWIYVSILKIFKGKLEAFAINKQVHCVSMAVFQVLVILTQNHFDIKWLMFGSVLLIIPTIWCLFKIDFSLEIYGQKLKQNVQK